MNFLMSFVPWYIGLCLWKCLPLKGFPKSIPIVNIVFLSKEILLTTLLNNDNKITETGAKVLIRIVVMCP